MRDLARDLIANCEAFLKDECGRIEPSGIDDPWLEYEEVYKRAHSFETRRDIGWVDEASFDAADLQTLAKEVEYERVIEAFRVGGFDEERFSFRWREIDPKAAPRGLAEARSSLAESIRSRGTTRRKELDGRYAAIEEGSWRSARLQRLLAGKQNDELNALYVRAQNRTNLVDWRLWPAFSMSLVEELATFLDQNLDHLDHGSFERFVHVLSTQHAVNSPKPLAPAAVRTVVTFWLFVMNPSEYLFLKRNDFGEAVSATYGEADSRLLSYDEYAAVLDGAQELREALRREDERWAPRDLIDVQTLLWLRLRGPSIDVERPRPSPRIAHPGVAYREAKVAPPAYQATPFHVDPDKVERGNRGHADTQNRLATALRTSGIEPLSPKSGDPEFDIA